MPSYKLVYFPGRGRAEPIRMCFAAAGVAYEDKRIAGVDWAAYKPNTLFGQIPILTVDGKDLAQSGTIIRYVARELDLAPKDSFKLAQCDMIVDAVSDVVAKMYAFVFCKDEAKKEELKTQFYSITLPEQLVIFEKLLSSNNGGNGYFVGDELTFADIVFFTYANSWLAQGKTEVPSQLKSHTKLLAHYNRVLNLPNIKKWLENRPKTAM